MFAGVLGRFWRWLPPVLRVEVLLILPVALTLVVVVRLGCKARGSAIGVGIAVVVVAIEGAYRFGDVMARIGNGKLRCVPASACKAAANIAGSG